MTGEQRAELRQRIDAARRAAIGRAHGHTDDRADDACGVSGYYRGCRCSYCRSCIAAQKRAYRARLKAAA